MTDLTFFNQVKLLVEDDGCSWKDSGEGFLWTDSESASRVVVWFYYLYDDRIDIIIGVDGFHKGGVSLDERHFMYLYEATGGRETTILNVTKNDWISMKWYLYNNFEKAIRLSIKN